MDSEKFGAAESTDARIESAQERMLEALARWIEKNGRRAALILVTAGGLATLPACGKSHQEKEDKGQLQLNL